MNTVHVSGLWNLYDCQAQLSTVTHVCHHKKVPSFSSCVCCFKMNQTVVEHVVYWLDSMISSTHSDKYDKWQAHSTCWPLGFSMGVSTVWHPAMVKHVCLSLFAWVVTNQWANKNSSTLTLHPGYALWDIPLFFQIEAKYLTCREQLQAKQLRQYLKLMKTLYTVCYAQVDWYTNTSHKNCRQTMCNVVQVWDLM